MCCNLIANMWNICERSSLLYQNESISGWKVEKLYVSAFIFRKKFKFIESFLFSDCSDFFLSAKKIHISRVIKELACCQAQVEEAELEKKKTQDESIIQRQ